MFKEPEEEEEDRRPGDGEPDLDLSIAPFSFGQSQWKCSFDPQESSKYGKNS